MLFDGLCALQCTCSQLLAERPALIASPPTCRLVQSLQLCALCVVTCRARPSSWLPVPHPAVCCSPGSSYANGDPHWLQPGEQLGVSHVIVHNAKKPAARNRCF